MSGVTLWSNRVGNMKVSLMSDLSTQIAIIGAGNTGIATAYYLAQSYNISDILLIDSGQPMAFTSAQSGENYRNWWPRPDMVAFTDRSIALMEDISRGSGNRIAMNRRGYALATRTSDVEDILQQLRSGLGTRAETMMRFHANAESGSYAPPLSPNWESAPSGVDILQNQDLIRKTFPSYDRDIRTVIHIRTGGDLSGQQLGMHMLEACREHGIARLTGEVKEISRKDGFTLTVASADTTHTVRADKIINAAGPFASEIAGMLDVSLPIHNTFQQKIAFEDRREAIPRDMPFSIDLDDQLIDWSQEDRAILMEDEEYRWLAEAMPGAIHCRPDGGDKGRWLKMGWAFNETAQLPSRDRALDDQFPEIVLRGAARLNPSLKAYYGQLPRNTHHYGGFYTMTDENWPLIGPMGEDGAYMNCALSGFGTMAACAAGELCAAWTAGAELPSYAKEFSLQRYQDAELMAQLRSSRRGLL